MTDSPEHHRQRSEFIRGLVQRSVGQLPINDRYTQGTSRTIVQFWHDLRELPEDVEECIASWVRWTMRGFTHRLFDERSAKAFIRDSLDARHEHAPVEERLQRVHRVPLPDRRHEALDVHPSGRPELLDAFGHPDVIGPSAYRPRCSSMNATDRPGSRAEMGAVTPTVELLVRSFVGPLVSARQCGFATAKAVRIAACRCGGPRRHNCDTGCRSSIADLTGHCFRAPPADR